jgi:hypothetical protein
VRPAAVEGSMSSEFQTADQVGVTGRQTALPRLAR